MDHKIIPNQDLLLCQRWRWQGRGEKLWERNNVLVWFCSAYFCWIQLCALTYIILFYNNDWPNLLPSSEYWIYCSATLKWGRMKPYLQWHASGRQLDHLQLITAILLLSCELLFSSPYDISCAGKEGRMWEVWVMRRRLGSAALPPVWKPALPDPVLPCQLGRVLRPSLPAQVTNRHGAWALYNVRDLPRLK